MQKFTPLALVRDIMLNIDSTGATHITAVTLTHEEAGASSFYLEGLQFDKFFIQFEEGKGG